MVNHKLYRYRSLETSRDYENAVNAICENKLYFPSPLKFNDPFDSKPLIVIDELTDEDWERILEKHKKQIQSKFPNTEIKELIRLGLHNDIEIRENLDDEVLESIGICSFCKSNNDILMWSHYSNGHRGYCLEFDPSQDPKFFESVKPVIYNEERPKIKSLGVDNQGDIKFDDEELNNSLLTKSDQWCYEDEFRIINSVEGSKYYTFLPESLTGIILGIKISDQNKTIIQSLNCKRKSPVEIIEAKLKESEFGLEVYRRTSK